VSDLPGGTAVMDLSADIDYSLLSQALRRLRAQLTQPDAIATEAAAVNRARRSVASELRLDAWTTYGLAFSIFDAWVRGWQVEMLDQLPEKALAGEAATLETIARHCRKNWVLGLLGDQRRMQAAWEESGQPQAERRPRTAGKSQGSGMGALIDAQDKVGLGDARSDPQGTRPPR
jgi:hypothetical protein